MFENFEEELSYIKDNFENITNSHINDNLWDLECGKCKVVRGFHVERRTFTNEKTRYARTGSEDFYAPRTVYLRCPVCDLYKIIIYFAVDENDDGKYKYYRVIDLPNENFFDIEVLPKDHPNLRKAFTEAIKAMDVGAYCAGAAMLRKALQIITRDIGGATPGKLADELKSLAGKKINGVTFSQDFSNYSYLVKEAGNQGVHPDKDSDLLDFSQQDAKDLYQIFMKLVADLFIAPKAAEDAVARFKQNRKIK